MRQEVGVARGLEKVGKTRFATHYWSALSVERNLLSISSLVKDGSATIKVSDVLLHWVAQSLTPSQGLDDGVFMRQHSKANTTYMRELTTYTSIMAPIARSIKALEGRAANAADVYIFWIAIAASLQKLFLEDEDIDGELAHQVTAIVNRRYKEFIDNSPTDIYFTAFFLDPRKPQHSTRNKANIAV
jgi:hypothetical protein